MSAIKAKVSIPCDMRSATDDESPTRYGGALACLQVVPRAGGVYLTATSGRVLAVVPADGKCDGEHAIPPQVLPSKAAHWKLGPVGVELNGKWEAAHGVFAAEPEFAKFPKYADVLPVVSDETHYALTIDPQLLMDLATAIGRGKTPGKNGPSDRDERGVTLFVAKDYSCNKGIGVVGAKGFGVLMPMGGAHNAQIADTQAEYAAKVAAYRDAQAEVVRK